MKNDETKALTEKLRFLRSLKFKLYWVSSNYEIAGTPNYIK